MAPVACGKACLSLLRALFSAPPPLASAASSLSRRPIAAAQRLLLASGSSYGWAQPWQHHVVCRYSDRRGGGGRDGEDDGLVPSGKARPSGSSFSMQGDGGSGGGDEDVGLFGEGGVFGPIGKGRGSEDNDEYQREGWEAQQGGEDEFGALASAGSHEGAQDWPYGKGSDEGPADMDAGEGQAAQEEAAFGDHVAKAGYTEDEINNMILGFYEPTTLPHLDDYVFVDKDAQIKKKRRQIELEKIAETTKRWVKKVDAHGFAHGVGRRKSSNARVWIKEGEGKIIINRKYHDMYFTSMDNRAEFLEPFLVTATMGMFDAFILVRGGGISGQAGAIRHGLARALMWYDPSYRPILKEAGLLRRDDRVVERKKPGKAKARKSFQWVKR